MKNKKTIYVKYTTRDFCLPLIEIWSRAETTDPRQWTKKKQPKLPYMIFVRENGFVFDNTDVAGIEWIKKEILKISKFDSNFTSKIVSEFYKRVKPIKNIWEEKKILNRHELVSFLAQLRDGWAWFEAVWWIMDMADIKSKDFRLTKKARLYTENMVPYSDILIKKSLIKIYPSFRDCIYQVTLDEISTNNIPSVKELKKRQKGYAFTNSTLFSGQGFKEMEKKFNIRFAKEPKIKSNIKEFKGSVACNGIVRGKVRRLMTRVDVKKLLKGEVLVSPMTMPDYLPAMIKASAIITDEGGVTSHASIVAREMNKPCIIGTKIATQVLKDGDLVEVDADNGVVRILKKYEKNAYRKNKTRKLYQIF